MIKKVLLSSLALCCSTVFAAKDLATIQNQIQQTRQDLKQQQVSRDQLQQNIKETENQLSKLTLEQQKLSAQQKALQASLKQLQQQQTAYEAELLDRRADLAQKIRLAYMLGDQPSLKLLLSHEDLTRVGRDLTYYQYVARYQAEAVMRLSGLLQQLEQNQQEIADKTAQLDKLAAQQKTNLAQINTQKRDRAQALQQLNGDIQSKNSQLQKLLADKAALEEAVRKANAAAQSVGGAISWPAGGSFAKAQGKLSWPTRGKLMAGFDSKIAQSELKLNGVLIGAAEGQPVYSIAPGRVVFAEWLSGYGLLMIVDHGQGYMTLYGRNGTLYKKVGDAVTAGEQIATVGKTGGYTQPSLYFAIRQQGTPLNPQAWCK